MKTITVIIRILLIIRISEPIPPRPEPSHSAIRHTLGIIGVVVVELFIVRSGTMPIPAIQRCGIVEFVVRREFFVRVVVCGVIFGWWDYVS